MKNYSNYNPRKVVITVDKNVTLARVFDNDNKVVAKGVAKCNPEDTFDFKMGAELAMKRAFESTTPKIDLKTTKWVKVDRKPVPGDYVRIVKPCFTFDRIGDVLKVYKATDNNVQVRAKDHANCDRFCMCNGENYIWNYNYHEVEVVEPVVKPTKQYRKLDRPPRPGDYIRLTRVDTNVSDNFDSVGDVLKISTCVMGGLVVGVHVNDHPKLVAHYKGVENIPFGNCDQIWMYGKLFEDYEFVEEVTE